ncbi:MAG: VCBS repeat-containing protein [Myxococcota bacterium]|nr:VCBS repeat-containing protein [Myxococcota bacterium]
MLLAVLALACNDYRLVGNNDNNGGNDDTASGDDTGLIADLPEECKPGNWEPMQIGTSDQCPDELPPGFTPEIEWEMNASGGCLSLPVVADLDGDGLPNVLVLVNDGFSSPATLYNEAGDGSGTVWSKDLQAGAGSIPAVADIDGDGDFEIAIIKEYVNGIFSFSEGEYSTLLLDHNGNLIWESEHVGAPVYDGSAAPSFADMDGDGVAELVVGAAILNAETGATIGVGEHGHGSYGISQLGDLYISETAVSAVADLDLDGQAEVIVGNAAYNKDGSTIWHNAEFTDGMVGVANLDSDPEGEIVAISGASVRAMEHDGTVKWGPITIPSANILSTPAIGDIDLDGMPEIVVAGGNELWALNHDGTVLWSAAATDESGATGASIFDFEGDGQPEVVYIDEVQMIAFDGSTGGIKFYSTEHASNTMFDYPTIADVDGDHNAEILVCHNSPLGGMKPMSVYGDADSTWADARPLWNQHGYSINNINDDGTIPAGPQYAWQDHNTWHGALAESSPFEDGMDLAVEILEVCEDECAVNRVFVTWRVLNYAEVDLEAGVSLALYADDGGTRTLVGTVETKELIPAGWTGNAQVTELTRDDLMRADKLWVVVDDDGTGASAIGECSEANNETVRTGGFCQ